MMSTSHIWRFFPPVRLFGFLPSFSTGALSYAYVLSVALGALRLVASSANSMNC
jgi:hypothetical protein